MHAEPTEPAPLREHFIPLRATDLAQLLANSELIAPGQQAAFLGLCRMLKAIFHFEYHEQLLRVKDTYAPFDPDADTLRLKWDDAPAQRSDEFFDSLVNLFERANFRRLDRVELQQAFEVTSEWGLNLDVDFSIFDRLEVFARGERVIHREHRTWRSWFRTELKDVLVHQRLVVAFRLREELPEHSDLNGTVTLKMFKEIPKSDIEMLLPGTRVRMTLLDRAKIALPTISGLMMAVYKIVRAGVVIAFAGAYSMLSFLGLIGGTIGYGVKSFFGYLRTKDKYQADLTRNLYYQNLDNNAGVLFRLLDEVEEQEFREAVLAYSVLTDRAAPNGRTLDELDVAAEELLAQATDLDIDFEADDAINKLVRLGLVTKRDQRYKAIPLQEAQQVLCSMWAGYLAPEELKRSA